MQILRGVVATSLACTIAACAHDPEQLRPAAMARPAGHIPNAALAEDAGVAVIAQADGWPAAVDSGEAPASLAPFKVWIHNGSDLPLQVRLDSFLLAAADGTHYRAIPVIGVGRGRVPQTVIEAPEFVASRFEVAPYLARAYPDLPSYDGTFAFEGLYYARFRDTPEVALVPREARPYALPEGVLEPGGRLEGYVFFERPRRFDLEKGNVQFTVQLAPEAAQPAVARLAIPFAERD